MTDDTPRYPFEQVSCDLFSIGRQHYLAYADRLSGYPMACQWGHDPSSKEVIRACRAMFGATGVPRKLRSDNGPQFASAAFKTFLGRWGVEWAPSTPHYPVSNGHAELNVKVLKSLLKKMPNPDIDSDEFIEGLLELRNTPRADGLSPCQVVFGHPVRTRLPTHHTAYEARWQTRAEEVDARRAAISKKAREHYDRSAKPLKPMSIGTRVRIQDTTTKLWDRVGEIVGVGRHRDYHIKMPSGRVLWRNRRFIRKYHDGLERENDGGEDENNDIKEEDDIADDEREQVKKPTIVSEPRRSSRKKKNIVRFGINHVRYFIS